MLLDAIQTENRTQAAPEAAMVFIPRCGTHLCDGRLHDAYVILARPSSETRFTTSSVSDYRSQPRHAVLRFPG
jgi:hypothetical protein